MKVAEVRTALKKYTKEELIEQYIAAYKEVPKAKRETDLDPLIQEGIQKGTQTKKTKGESVDFPALKDEIETFIDYAEDDLYYVPNRTVPKAKRSKWRFDVMRFYKDLQKIQPGDQNYDASNELLEKLFKLLSLGCGYYKFNTDDPFASIQVEQYDFYEVIAKRKLAAERSPKVILDLCDLAIYHDLSRDCLHVDFFSRLDALLASDKEKETALAAVQDLAKKYQNEFSVRAEWSHGYYDARERLDLAGQLYLVLCCGLGREEEGAAYWFSLSKERTSEITLYRILGTVGSFGTDEAYVKIYDKAVEDGIKPRDTLQKNYEQHKEALKNESEE